MNIILTLYQKIKCLLWKHELDVKSIWWVIINQTVKCNKCSYTLEICYWKVKRIK
jgi:hypothetical protein